MSAAKSGPRFVLHVVGDEVLLGKRTDRHFSHVVERLRLRGFTLEAAHFIGDDETELAGHIRRARESGVVLLSCGGIGATPDDVTRQAAARGWDVPIERHPEALAEIIARLGDKAYPNRVLMADFPQGARIIPNPVNRIAGFSIGEQHYVPGFPEMAWPMLEWVLETYYDAQRPQVRDIELRLRVGSTAAEGDLLDLMEETLRRHAGVKLSSLPFRGDATHPAHIELGVRGAPVPTTDSFGFLRAELGRLGYDIEILQGPE